MVHTHIDFFIRIININNSQIQLSFNELNNKHLKPILLKNRVFYPTITISYSIHVCKLS